VHLINLLGALAVGYADLQATSMRRRTELDDAALAALLAVYTRPASTVGDVARTTGLTHSGAVRTIDRLQDNGLITRTPGADRRRVGLYCTDAGTAKAEDALTSRRADLAALIGAATPTDDELVVLERFLEQLLEGLPKTDRGDAWHICRLCEHAACRGDDCPVGRTVP
jgi:DNA-binding MarR family transcriptional regulator